MRVTENTNYETVRNNLKSSRERLDRLQVQSATLRKLVSPSDDPIGTAKVLEIRTEKAEMDQFQMSAKMAQMFLDSSDHALQDVTEILLRAKEIALNQSSGASANEQTRLGIAEEVEQLYQQAVGAANRRIGDRYIFGGYRTNTPPVNNRGEYQGDAGNMMAEVSKEVFVVFNIPGLDVFNTVPKSSSDYRRVMAAQKEKEIQSAKLRSEQQSGKSVEIPHMEENEDNPATTENTNLFQTLEFLRVSLLTGDIQGIRSTLDALDDLYGWTLSMRSKVGSRIQGIQSADNAMERHAITNATLKSSIEDADMSKVMSDMAKEETVFRSTLESSKRLIQPNLIEFLR